MATSKIALTEGTGKNAATYSVSEDAVTKEVQRVSLNTSGGSEAGTASNPLVVDLGTNNDITGTVTAELSATDNAVLDNIDADLTTVIGHVDGIEALLTTIDADTSKIPSQGQALAAASMPVVLPEAQITTLTPPAAITGFATSAKQDTLIGHVDGVETLLGTIDADTSALAGAIAGTEVQVDVVSSALPTGASTAAKQPALGTAGTASSDVLTVQGIASMTPLTVDLGENNDVTITSGTVTANLGATDNAVLDDIAAKLATIDADTSTLAGAVSTEVQVDVVGALPAGTNAIGKLLPPDVDVTTHTNYARKYYTSAGAATDGIIWSPAAGKRWHVVTMYLQTSADATVTLEDDLAAGDSAVWKSELKAGSGAFLVFPEKYPLASGEDAADLLVTTSAGNIYITVTGYEI